MNIDDDAVAGVSAHVHADVHQSSLGQALDRLHGCGGVVTKRRNTAPCQGYGYNRLQFIRICLRATVSLQS